MDFLRGKMSSRKSRQGEDAAGEKSAAANRELDGPAPRSSVASQVDNRPVRIFRARIIYMGVIVSLGGMVFGNDTGQISGFLEMTDFINRFGNTDVNGMKGFSDSRSGTIVGLLSIGTLLGALVAAPTADILGRRIAIIIGNIIFCAGLIVQITTNTNWRQLALGRWTAGIGVGMLSILTPMYQSETAPRQVRGALVSSYQLFITLGILFAYFLNFGTEKDKSARSWKLPIAITFIWPVIMMCGVPFLRESPRWDYRKGKIDRARKTIALSYGVPENHWEVRREMEEIKAKFEAETSGGAAHKWHSVFTGPRMAYRTLLGITMQALQQLTGANFFFYYGTSVFKATGLNNSYVTSIILGAVNFGTTFWGLYVVEHFGRRKSLITGALCMFVCFMVFASVGAFSLSKTDPQSTPGAGTAMIVFACFFITAFASTWGPIVWVVVGEIYPSRYRAKAMALATASNWTFNFLLSFFTPFITNDIGYKYGYVFAGCCLAGAIIVYFFLAESSGRSLEEIDTMYILKINPIKSSKWQPSEEDLQVSGEGAIENAGNAVLDDDNKLDGPEGTTRKEHLSDSDV